MKQRCTVCHRAIDHLTYARSLRRKDRRQHAERHQHAATAKIADGVDRLRWLFTRATVPMKVAGKCDIVDVVPRRSRTHLASTPFGLTRSAALQYARRNIRINAICPGVTRTAILRRAMQQSPDAEAAINSHSPMGRMAESEEVAEAAIWLASDKSSFVNGHALVIDGGATVQ